MVSEKTLSLSISYFCSRCGFNYLIGGENYMQYLIREFTDSTGHIHTDIEKARTNETLSIVEAEDKEEAKKKVSERNV